MRRQTDRQTQWQALVRRVGLDVADSNQRQAANNRSLFSAGNMIYNKDVSRLEVWVGGWVGGRSPLPAGGALNDKTS